VIASVRDVRKNITHVDTLFVTVTDQTPASPIATFAIQRPPGDSAKIGVYTSGMGVFQDTVLVAATAVDGTDLRPALFVRFMVSDSSIAKIDAVKGIVTGLRPGQVTVRAMATYYGITKTDSLRLTIGNPVLVGVAFDIQPSPITAGQYVRVPNPGVITIGVGGTVAFVAGLHVNGPDLAFELVFDDPDSAQPSPMSPATLGMGTGSGNIGPLPSVFLNGSFNPACLPVLTNCLGSARSFAAAGTYRYHAVVNGVASPSGTIIVAAP
jgi:hypothetical protein